MRDGLAKIGAILAAGLAVAASSNFAQAQDLARLVVPEERGFCIRDAVQLPMAPIPDSPAPPTVGPAREDMPVRPLSLDQAISIALGNSEVVRVLAGVTAVSSGRTIYDPAISNTLIDIERARFDPSVEVLNGFNRLEAPQAIPDPLDPTRTGIAGTRSDDYDLALGLTKQTTTGGLARLGVSANPARFQPGVFPLNPQNRSSLELSFTQPLLRGAGVGPNVAPIVIARINTEQSFFQLKGGVQDLVVGTIEAYWALVFARTDAWARAMQVEQAQWAYDLTRVESQVGRKNIADVSQTRVALANFRANLIAAEANMLQRQGALRDILGLAPADGTDLVPMTPPATERRQFDWDGLVELAEERRPDLIELKLIIEADEQLLVQARNDALPNVDAVALYRWNGLEGEMPSGASISSRPGEFTDWTLGINFSVPIGLRQSRSALRRQELVIVRDWANLQQGLHQVGHLLATNLRDLALAYEQYEAFQETRSAARINLEAQTARYREGLTPFLNVLLAIADWGNAVSAEARALTDYNVQLAILQRQTGTVLETHGVRFTEERFGSIGPLGRLGHDRLYPSGVLPTPNVERYPRGSEPAEKSFGLDDPVLLRQRRSPAPPEPLPSPRASDGVTR